MTGLGTRQALELALEALVDAQRPGAVALVEIDGYRALTLRRGVAHVDLLLQRVATRLHELEPDRGFLVQDGTFAVVLPSAGDLDGWAHALGAQLGATHPDVTVSIGTARTERGARAATLQERAGVALRAAKRRGNGSCADYASQEQTASVGVTPEKAQALYDVLSAGELRVHYQPIVDLRDGRTIGFEALARPQVTHGLSGPLEAFEVALKLGLVPELDAVCRTSILADGPGYDMPRGARLHINLSPLSLGHRSLSTPVLRRQLADAGLEPRRVVFELTEGSDVEPGVADRELRRLADGGFTLLLDEVGTGDAGLGRLGTGRFHALKIATGVIAATATSAHAVGIVEAVCAFARHTGTAVIAGGVADADLLRFVQHFRAAGCPDWRIPAAQGYQLGRPNPRARAARAISVDAPAQRSAEAPVAQKQAAASHG